MMHDEDEILMSDLDPEDLGEEDELEEEDLEGGFEEDEGENEKDPFGVSDSEEETW